jgi:hypothetical protein
VRKTWIGERRDAGDDAADHGGAKTLRLVHERRASDDPVRATQEACQRGAGMLIRNDGRGRYDLNQPDTVPARLMRP